MPDRTSPFGTVGAIWGLLGLLALLLRAIVGLAPIALEPILDGSLSAVHWAALAGWVGFMAYTEGYRGFQLKFSPFVAARMLELRAHPTPLRVALAPAFCMGLFHATRRRLFVSWGVLLGVTALIVLVRLLDQPWRGIVDAGVVVGLSWGTLSLLTVVGRAVVSGRSSASAELPERSAPA